MQYIFLALIVPLIIFTKLGCAAARQSTYEQNSDLPSVEPDKPAQPAADLLTSGKNILQQGYKREQSRRNVHRPGDIRTRPHR